MLVTAKYRVDCRLNIGEIRSGQTVFLVPLQLLQDMFGETFIVETRGEYKFTTDEWAKLRKAEFTPSKTTWYGKQDDPYLPSTWPRRSRKEGK